MLSPSNENCLCPFDLGLKLVVHDFVVLLYHCHIVSELMMNFLFIF